MRKTELIKKFQSLDKAFYTTSDLQLILGLSTASTYSRINDLVRDGFLQRLAKEVYVPVSSYYNLDEIANQLYYPSYLSFESALAKYSMLNQIPYTLTFATNRRSKKRIIAGREVVWSHMNQNVFFGYENVKGLMIATREKALLDQMYFVSFGKAGLDYEELNLDEIDEKKLFKMAKKFPKRTQKKLEEVKPFIGKVSVTVK